MTAQKYGEIQGLSNIVEKIIKKVIDYHVFTIQAEQ